MTHAEILPGVIIKGSHRMLSDRWHGFLKGHSIFRDSIGSQLSRYETKAHIQCLYVLRSMMVFSFMKYDMASRFQTLSYGWEIPAGITSAVAVTTSMTAAFLSWRCDVWDSFLTGEWWDVSLDVWGVRCQSSCKETIARKLLHQQFLVARPAMQARTLLDGKPCWFNRWNVVVDYSKRVWSQLCLFGRLHKRAWFIRNFLFVLALHQHTRL